MDSNLNAAALALSHGDVLGALNRIALRDDADALAMRGIAMAQLGELPRARDLLRAAAKAFGPSESVARARCILAEAEIALVSRDLAWPVENLESAGQTLLERGDLGNAAHAAITAARRHLLLGHLDLATTRLAGLDSQSLPPALAARRDLVLAGIDIRRKHAVAARSALARAQSAARQSGIAGLVDEVAAAQWSLDEPAAVLHQSGTIRPILLDEVERVLASKAMVVDATSNTLRSGPNTLSLASRPILMGLAVALAEAWPGVAARESLLARVFGARHVDESHRTRLRVEIARLRKLVAPMARLSAAPHGYRLVSEAGDVVILSHPMGGQDAQIMALLADGELWASSAIALVLGLSTRSVQRSLQALQATGKIQSVGRARTIRWTILAAPGFPMSLMLPGAS
ncbi:helix-turn-helix domain-containing protein [Devosia aquimaris]|uniref:helix-turn-helix domain-containing protein n=1 Tax=Devosia aquimaris TaxID=2866214 RepID=UPI001CD133C8|nr:helix-turn-helix domain-containing protein [Devosia sp. CJK-A8-3]